MGRLRGAGGRPGGSPPSATVPSLAFGRDGEPVGAIVFPRVVAPAATSGGSAPVDRSRSRIVFLDAIDPSPAPGEFPFGPMPRYTVVANLEAAAAQGTFLEIRLPVTTQPSQTPRIAATGIVESDYVSSPDYSRTSPRDRFLWIEFAEPLADPDDGYFARVLAYGPDPLLASALPPKATAPPVPPEAPEPDLPLDPEPVRAIFSGQSSDEAGLDAMTQLVPAVSGGFGADGPVFMLPLPPGTTSESLELFGFWTYEFRVGHARRAKTGGKSGSHERWSTAQGRFGRPLRVTGLQHPSPHLICAVQRTQEQVIGTAAYATTVRNGLRVFDLDRGDPQTQIWFMLYTQVRQADGAAYRNVLIDRGLGEVDREVTAIVFDRAPAFVDRSTFDPARAKLDVAAVTDEERRRLELIIAKGQSFEQVAVAPPARGPNRQPIGGVSFEEGVIRRALERLGLPVTSSLSMLAVELLPGRSESGRVVHDNADEDPLGGDLGLRRILRTSPLVAVPPIC